jgi:thioredoxin-like negative regulator of GroEL
MSYNLNNIIIVFAVIILVIYILNNSQCLKNFFNKQENFDNNSSLILYYTEWCGHSQRFLPTWQELEKKYGNKMQLKKIDCDKEKCEGVAGFPTIILFKDNKQIEYNGGDRSMDSLEKFINAN